MNKNNSFKVFLFSLFLFSSLPTHSMRAMRFLKHPITMFTMGSIATGYAMNKQKESLSEEMMFATLRLSSTVGYEIGVTVGMLAAARCAETKEGLEDLKSLATAANDATKALRYKRLFFVSEHQLPEAKQVPITIIRDELPLRMLHEGLLVSRIQADREENNK